MRQPRGRADALDEWIHLTAVASGLEHVYSGMEKAFKIIAAEIDGAVRAFETAVSGASRSAKAARRG